MNIVSIIVFFIMLWGFGSFTSFFSKKEWYEQIIMQIAIGLAVFTVLASVFTILHIPLSWYIFFILSLLSPLILYLKKKPSLSFKQWKPEKPLSTVWVALLFAFTLFMYLTGAFAYPLYENGDPWRHAGAATYISEEKTALEPVEGVDVFQYIDAYPPAYDILISVMHQITGDVVWTIKFFNSLIISLGIVFFFYLARKFTGHEMKALIAATALTFVPSYMSHFIWAHTLVIALLFPLLYAIIHTKKQWIYVAALCYAAVLLAQPTQAVKITLILGIYLVVKSSLMKRMQWNVVLAGVYGAVLAFIAWWGPMLLKYGSLRGVLSALGTGVEGVTKGAGLSSLKFHGTADRLYTFHDFFYAQSQNMINNPIGVGIVLMLLLFFTLAFVLWKYKSLLKENNHWIVITACWLLFAFLGIHGERLPVQLWAFRFWMLFAIFLSLFVAEGVMGLTKLGKKVNIPTLLILILLLGGVWFTSGTQKFDVNTANWQPSAGEFYRYGNLPGWEYLANELPEGSTVFSPCRHSVYKDVAILGVGAQSCVWCEDETAFKLTHLNRTGEEIQHFAQSKGYDYLYIDGICFDDMLKADIPEEEWAPRINAWLTNISAPLAYRSEGAFVFRI